MKRSMMQVYVKNSNEAVLLYQKAFDAKLTAEYKNDDGTYMHAELDIEGQIVSLSEATNQTVGDNMQFCFHYGEGGKRNEAKIKKAYEILKVGGTVICPPEECSFSPLMTCIIDKFGVNWGLFI